MTTDHDINALAGEFVLGTLDAAEREVAARRIVRDRAFAQAVANWERRLALLLLQTPSVTPPADGLEKIKTKISMAMEAADRANNVVSITRSRARWRAAAVSMAAIAASLVAVIGTREINWSNRPTTFVAVLQKDSMSPAFILSVDTKSMMLTVRPVDAKREPGKSFELWLVHDSLGAPRSLGLLPDDAPVTSPTLRKIKKSVFMGATYAVSVEPMGGSQTGAPTGPVVFAGKLLPDGI